MMNFISPNIPFCVRFFLYLSLSYFLLGNTSHAWCNSSVAAQTLNVSMGPVVVQRDTPIGSVLKSVATDSYKEIIGCDSALGFKGVSRLPISSLSNVYQTNIPGIGLRFSSNGSQFPFDLPTRSGLSYYGRTTVDLVKYSDTGSGSLTSGQVGQLYYGNGGRIIANINLLSSEVRSTTCSVMVSSLNVNMGMVERSSFSNVGYKGPDKSFKVELNCSKDVSVNIRIDGVKDSSGAEGVLNLNNKSGVNSASGIGVMVSYNNKPISINSIINVETVNSDGLYSIPFTANYYQTEELVKAGSADATATFTMIYK